MAKFGVFRVEKHHHGKVWAGEHLGIAQGMIVNAVVTIGLTTGKNGKNTFLTCHCHNISRVEAVVLKKSNYTLRITIYVCEI